MPAAELIGLFYLGSKHQVQVGRVYIAVGDDRPAGQDRQRGGYAGLSGAALSADDNKFCDNYLLLF